MVSCRKIEYPGVVQLIERAVWDREARGFEPHHSDHMNEVRFLNNFIEKRTSHFLKALQQQGFFFLLSFNTLMKK